MATINDGLRRWIALNEATPTYSGSAKTRPALIKELLCSMYAKPGLITYEELYEELSKHKSIGGIINGFLDFAVAAAQQQNPDDEDGTK